MNTRDPFSTSDVRLQVAKELLRYLQERLDQDFDAHAPTILRLAHVSLSTPAAAAGEGVAGSEIPAETIASIREDLLDTLGLAAPHEAGPDFESWANGAQAATDPDSIDLAREIADLLNRRLSSAKRARGVDALLAVLATEDPGLIRRSFGVGS